MQDAIDLDDSFQNRRLAGATGDNGEISLHRHLEKLRGF